MIHVEKSKVHIMGAESDIVAEFGMVVAAMADEFGLERTLELVTTAVVVLRGTASKVDLTQFEHLMDKMKSEDKDDDEK